MRNILKIYGLGVFTMFTIAACGKKDADQEGNKQVENTTVEQSTDGELVLEPRLLTTEKGDSIYLTYFSKEDKVAVKLKINGEERELVPNGTSDKGNPVLSDGEYGWEIYADGKSGRLFGKNIESKNYRER